VKEETKKLGLEELFREVVSEMSANLAAFSGTLRLQSPDADCCQEAYSIAHSLHGSGKLYGYPCVSELGASLEKVTAALRDRHLPATPALASLVGSCSAALSALCDGHAADEAARAGIRDLAWECECVLHASPADAAAAAPDAPTASA
jgi:chemotaxis protein histidine kinase CheA